MPLPEVIEIEPFGGPVQATVAVPGSKSLTNRALVLAALAKGEVALRGALWSEDTQVLVEALRRLGYRVDSEPEAASENRTLRVAGRRGLVPPGGSPENPLELHVGNAGTAARFLTALLCLGQGAYRLDGTKRMRERPQAALIQALRELGYRIDTPNDRLPAVVHGAGPKAGRCRVEIRESSQFASALILAGQVGGWDVEVAGEDLEEARYIDMTRRLVERFPVGGGEMQIEPDASSGSYFWAAGRLAPMPASDVRVKDWPDSGWQVDERFPEFLDLPEEVSRRRDLGDSILTAMILAPWSGRTVRFTDLGRLRVQECERVVAMRTELSRCGARVTEVGDTLEIAPSVEWTRGAEVRTYDDHRIAMCFSILGLKVGGMRIQNPACVKKTFPGFYRALAAPAPAGLGVRIRDVRTGEVLTGEALWAA